MVSRKRQVGDVGERVAAIFLKRKGYTVVATNYTNTVGYCLGEVDIVAKDGDVYVFCEVKMRRTMSSLWRDVDPTLAIGSAKLRKMERAARSFLFSVHCEDAPYRFDALAVWYLTDTNEWKVGHDVAIFR